MTQSNLPCWYICSFSPLKMHYVCSHNKICIILFIFLYLDFYTPYILRFSPQIFVIHMFVTYSHI